MDILNKNEIKKNLNKNLKGLKIFIYDEINSTQTKAKELLKLFPKENFIVISNSQKKGRGRNGKTFFSPKNSGIYITFCFNNFINEKEITKLSLYICLIIVKCINKILNKNLKIKWVNDIYLENKKVGGILIERSFIPKKQNKIFLGIGLNVFKPECTLNKELKEKISNISDPSEIKRNFLISQIINSIFKEIKNFNSTYFIDEYKKLSIVLNKEVILKQENTIKKFLAIDINKDGHLVLKDEHENIFNISYGEISIKINHTQN